MNKTDLHSSLLFLMIKLEEDKVDAEVPNINALIKENTSDEFIEKKINDVLGDDVELKEDNKK